MSRVVNLESTGKRRNQLRRTIAELLRHLSRKPGLDEEAQDMLALLVFSLYEIDAGIEQSAEAWEKRNYWVKAEELRQRWRWVSRSADQLRELLLNGDSAQVPAAIAPLLPHFSDLRINRTMRKPALWRGCYQRLLRESGPAVNRRD